MDKVKYDFSGWATRFNIECSDGRTIRKDAFKEADGTTVPLVWNHDHTDPNSVLGHALLECRDEGVYAYCSLNDTDQGKNARKLIEHGDICALSIYANKLKHAAKDVIHGVIREISMVLAGANPGAYIESVLAHSDGTDDEEAWIFNPDESLELAHSENEEGNKENKKLEDKPMPDPGTGETKKEKTINEVFETLNEEQKTAVYAIIGYALEQKNQEDPNMKHNAFEITRNDDKQDEELSHSEFLEIVSDAKNGSLKDSFLRHGITDVANLFPDAQAVNRIPETITRDRGWVQKVMNGVKHSPFSRVKSTAMNITEDTARAKGYVKGDLKAEQVVSALKRTTTPQTVYINQKMDRDDVVDITDFDVIAYLKQEMRDSLDEELARAFLIGDGRSSSDDHKINPLNIRPILGDSTVYTVQRILTRDVADTDFTFAKKFIVDMIKCRKLYKGSGTPALFTTEDMLTNMLLIEDTNGRVIYESIDRLKIALRVSDIITVPVMEGLFRTDDAVAYDYYCLGVLVNLVDYNVGADKGGSVNMFEDFDINYNKELYLIETRCSGALVKPYSAVSFELKSTHTAG